MRTKLLVGLAILTLIFYPGSLNIKAFSLSETVNGRVVINVEKQGEAWYVFPKTIQRYYLGNSANTFEVVKKLAVPVSNATLKEIGIGIVKVPGFTDSDSDGLWDGFELVLGMNYLQGDSDGDGYADGDEIANNYDPLSSGKTKIKLNSTTAKKYAGYILLATESHGEAWYVFPPENKRYYLGNADQAFKIITRFGLGITNANLNRVTAAKDSSAPGVVATKTIRLVAGEYLMHLDEKAIKLSKGNTLEITFVNQGANIHRFEIPGLNVVTGYISAGQSQIITVPIANLKAGSYTVAEVDNVAKEKGMTFNFTLSF